MGANLLPNPNPAEPNQPEAPSEPQAPDLMGYSSVEELVKAKRSSDAEAKRIAEENKQYKQQLSEVLPLAAKAVNQPGASPFDRLAEYVRALA